MFISLHIPVADGSLCVAADVLAGCRILCADVQEELATGVAGDGRLGFVVSTGCLAGWWGVSARQHWGCRVCLFPLHVLQEVCLKDCGTVACEASEL